MPRRAPMWSAPWCFPYWLYSRACGWCEPSMPEQRIVADDDDGIRVDRWFSRHFPALTHGRLEKLLRKGEVRVDGKRAKSADRVAAGQVMRLPPQVIHDKVEERPKPTPVIKTS